MFYIITLARNNVRLPEDDHVTETCRSVLSVLLQILDFLSKIYIYIYMCVCVLVCVIK